jgi:A/G-specific adenine glycosylase
LTDIKRASELTALILEWYERYQRDLPWRRTQDPYCIWISEIMLQQTQVETVIPYYHRFLERFPTLLDLSRASLDEVLKIWENLGYYARARHVHAAARAIVQRPDGRMPDNWDELRGLPGIGPYTAGAILSIAFDRPVPALDGNVRRVLSRLFAIREPLDHDRTYRRLWELAQALLPQEGPGRFNQALMDLGASICTPRKPICGVCPVREICLAYQDGSQETLPVKKQRKPIPHVLAAAGVIRDGGDRVLITQRPSKGLLGGLWKFPGGRQESGETLQDCLRRHIKEELNIRVLVGREIASVDHAYTHFRMTLRAFDCILQAGEPQPIGCVDWRWVVHRELGDLALSKADRKIIRAFRERSQT